MSSLIFFLQDTLKTKGLIDLTLLSFLSKAITLAPVLFTLLYYSSNDSVVSNNDVKYFFLLALFSLFILGYLAWKKQAILNKCALEYERFTLPKLFNRSSSSIASSANESSQKSLFDRIARVRTHLANPSLLSFFDCLWIPVFVTILFILHPYFGFVACIFSLLMYTSHYIHNALTSHEIEDIQVERRKSAAALHSYCKNEDLSFAMGRKKALQDGWIKSYLTLGNREYDCKNIWNFHQLLLHTLSSIAVALSIALSIFFVMHTHTPFGLALLGPFLIYQVTAPLKSALFNIHHFKAALLDSLEINKATPTATLRPNPVPSPAPPTSSQPIIENPNVEIIDASFGQNIEGPKISNVTLRLNNGKIHLFNGPQNSGKTDLCEAILGIQHCRKGRIEIAGYNNAILDKNTRHQLLGYSPQSAQIFKGTVAENITLFSGSSIADIIRTAKQAGIHSDILRLPQNYNTQIDDDSQLLSNTQKHLLSLARAIHNSPSILIFDDPDECSAAYSNALFLRLIRKFKAQGKTVVIASNSSVFEPYADHIYTLIDGQVQELNSNIHTSSRFSHHQLHSQHL